MHLSTFNVTHLKLLFHLCHKCITVQYSSAKILVWYSQYGFTASFQQFGRKMMKTRKLRNDGKTVGFLIARHDAPHWLLIDSRCCSTYTVKCGTLTFSFSIILISFRQCLFVLSISYFFHLQFGLNKFLFFKGLICDANRMIQILFVESWILSIWSKVCWSLK